MSASTSPHKLHLPDLAIQGFCGIHDLTINRLGRVTLIAGMNGVGKTTVLDAVRVFAGGGHSSELVELLERRDELYEYQNERGETASGMRWSSLFFNREMEGESTITIGPSDPAQRLNICLRPPNDDELPLLRKRSSGLLEGEPWTLATTTYGNDNEAATIAPIYRNRASATWHRGGSRTDGITCVSIGPSVLTNRQAQALWTSVALTDAESQAISALNLIVGAGGEIERIAVVGGEIERFTIVGEESFWPARTIARISGEAEPVPLRSLGDGAVRMFGLALALANSRDGFLLIDEVENGIHHSVQDRFWEMILHTAHANNVQVLATTHSWDAVAGYARAATQVDEVEGTLVRLERDAEGIYAVEYDERELAVIAKQGIEVR